MSLHNHSPLKSLPKEYHAECKALLAGNLELQLQVTQLADAIKNHKLNCQLSTLVDNKLWDTMDEILSTDEK